MNDLAVRMGWRQEQVPLQVNEINQRLKNRLFNAIFDLCKNRDDYVERIFKYIWTDLLSERITKIPFEYKQDAWGNTRFSAEATLDTIYDLLKGRGIKEWFYTIQFILNNYSDHIFVNACNSAFEKELAPYKIINNRLCPSSNEAEEEALTVALNITSQTTQAHLRSAIASFYSDDTHKFRKAVDESISAVESLSREYFNGKTLGDSIKVMQKNPEVFSPLWISILEKHWAYANSFARHGKKDTDPDLDYADAKYWLVTCSATINYITDKMAT